MGKKRKIYQFSMDGMFIKEYESIATACREHGMLKNSIIDCAQNRLKTAGGFIWSYKKESSVNPVKKLTSSVRVGATFEGNYGEYIVTEFSHVGKNHKFYKVKFSNTGSEFTYSEPAIRSGSVRDYLAPSVCGVGFAGSPIKSNKIYYQIWADMLARCYNSNKEAYTSHGAKGVTVCQRWHNFTLFSEDVKRIEGFDEEPFENRELVLDKDLKQMNKSISERYYSLETCMFLSASKNSQIASDPVVLTFLAKEIGKENRYNCYKNAKKFARENNVVYNRLRVMLKNKKQGVVDGWEIIRITREEYDQYEQDENLLCERVI